MGGVDAVLGGLRAARSGGFRLAGRAGMLRSVLAVETDRPEVVLTFDDGPDPVGTPAVLRALRDAETTATFFLLGTRCRRLPGLVEEILAEGHEVGLHGLDHAYLPALSSAEVTRRASEGRRLLETLTGRPVKWVRPPYLAQSLRSWRALTAAGLVPVIAESSAPSLYDSAEMTMEDRLKKATRGLRPGAIVIGHDGFAGPGDGAADGPDPGLDRYEIVTSVLREYSRRGLRGVSLEAALENGAAVYGPWLERDPAREPRPLLTSSVRSWLERGRRDPDAGAP